MKVLFFNRYPFLDLFVNLIAQSKEITVVRTIHDLREQAASNQFETLLINVDERLKETLYINELVHIRQRKMKIIIFGHYEAQAPQLTEIGVDIFLRSDSQINDFLLALACRVYID